MSQSLIRPEISEDTDVEITFLNYKVIKQDFQVKKGVLKCLLSLTRSFCLQASQENGRRDDLCSTSLHSGHNGGSECCSKYEAAKNDVCLSGTTRR